MAYLLGMILGNGEIQRKNIETTVTIEIPHKSLLDDENREVDVYVKSSLVDIRGVIEPLLGNSTVVTQSQRATKLSFTKQNTDYTMREVLRIIGHGVHHSDMTMSQDVFQMTHDEKVELLRGIADVTAYIRRSNIAFGQAGHHRVYIEIPGNWHMVIDVANLLHDVDVPVQTIDFGHPNFRDPKCDKYNRGQHGYWKKEHQVKIWANEFLPIGFNILHKQRALERYATELLAVMNSNSTHKYYWEKAVRSKTKPIHPAENDPSLPAEIRGRHFDSWQELAEALGYHE